MSNLRWLILPVLLGLACIAPRLGDRWFGLVEKLAARFAARKRATVLVIAFTAILARLALLWLLPVPLPAVHDEFSQLLAADTFAHGRLTNPPHPMWFFLDTFHVQQHPTYASIYPPAQGGVLALGQILGHPWIGVLLSMAGMCAAVTWMLQGWFPAEWALLGGALVLVRFDLFSYWINSYWGGAVAGVGGAMVLGAIPRIIHHQRSRDALVLGLGAVLLANSRPVEGLLFCIPLAVALIGWLFSQHGPALTVKGPRILLPLLCVMGPALVFMGYYNWRVTGNVFLFPHVLFVRQYANRGVFAWQTPNPPLHYSNPQFDYYYNVRLRSRYVPSWDGWKLQSWRACLAWWSFFLGGTLSISFVTLPWVLRDRRTRLLLVQFLLSVLGFLLIFAFEPHYAAPLTATVFALLIQALRHVRKWEFGRRPVGIGISRLVVLIALMNVPFYVEEMIRHSSSDEAWSSSRARIIKQLEAMPDRHLVLVRYSPRHKVDVEWVYNAADIDRSKVVWAREIPGQNLEPLLDYFQGRKVWLLEADASPPRLQPYTKAEAHAN